MQPEVMTRYVDLSYAELLAHALDRQEGVLSDQGVLTVETGARTGRSPKLRFLVDDAATHDTVDWGGANQPMPRDVADQLWEKAEAYLTTIAPFVGHLQVGADPTNHLKVQATTEYAWHQIFVRNMFIRPRETYVPDATTWRLLSLPGCTLDPDADGTGADGGVVLDIERKRVLLCGMRYAGEMKKAMFTVFNFLLPDRGILPMHCAANVGDDGDVSLFFGLSGTGKTTLSSDPDRLLIGDDEHGWSAEGVFNFEGGCYAKCINLSREREPCIWDAIKIGAVMENVVLHPTTHRPEFDNDRLTANTRVAYPRSHLPKRVKDNRAGPPRAVMFLTCDLYGVLPPVARLSLEQAAYYFLSGYTALVGSTEVGSEEAVKPTFSACFGAPFFPRRVVDYGHLLCERLQATGAQVYLVNTGWTGGGYATGGQRFDIATSRAVVRALSEGAADFSAAITLPGFGVELPNHVPGVSDSVLNPAQAWSDGAAYVTSANALIEAFQKNAMTMGMPEAWLAAGPQPLEAASTCPEQP